MIICGLSPDEGFSDTGECYGKSFPSARGGLCRVSFGKHHQHRHRWTWSAHCACWKQRFLGASAPFPKASQAQRHRLLRLCISMPNCWAATTQYVFILKVMGFMDVSEGERGPWGRNCQKTLKKALVCCAKSDFCIWNSVSGFPSMPGALWSLLGQHHPHQIPRWPHTNLTYSKISHVALLYPEAMSPREKSDGHTCPAKTSPRRPSPAVPAPAAPPALGSLILHLPTCHTGAGSSLLSWAFSWGIHTRLCCYSCHLCLNTSDFRAQ